MDDALKDAIKRALKPGSLYWSGFDETDPDRWSEVEIRINVPPEIIDSVATTGSWIVSRRDYDLGAIFMRRRQSLAKTEVRTLIIEALTMAYQHSGQFGSWIVVQDGPE
jgi:hypothetical protein